MRGLSLSVPFLFAWLLIIGQPLLAAPQPPIYVVNHTTKECGTILGGDECMDCLAPEGWETVSWEAEEKCPQGYSQAPNVEGVCHVVKDQFCCSEGHSGVHGDCEDLVIKKRGKLCAFVGDIQTAVLPKGWEQRPEGSGGRTWSCPTGYEWVASPEADPTPEAGPEPTSEADGDASGSGSGGLPCPGAALAGTTFLGLVLTRKR